MTADLYKSDMETGKPLTDDEMIARGILGSPHCDCFHCSMGEGVSAMSLKNTLCDALRFGRLVEGHRAEVRRLREAIEGALRIEYLWIPGVVDEEHDHEAVALHSMHAKFRAALK